MAFTEPIGTPRRDREHEDTKIFIQERYDELLYQFDCLETKLDRMQEDIDLIGEAEVVSTALLIKHNEKLDRIEREQERTREDEQIFFVRFAELKRMLKTLGSYLNELPSKLNRDPEHTREPEHHEHTHMVGKSSCVDCPIYVLECLQCRLP